MASDGISDGDTDLFGLPLLPEKGRGRPQHAWTKENSNLVNLLFACGRKPIEIARVLKISKPTFYKHYFNEIGNAGHAPLMMKARQLQRLNEQAEAGNVTAEKALAAMIQAEQIKVVGEHVRNRASEKTPAPAPLGKKDQARKDAAGVTGMYETRQPPADLLN